MESSRPGSATFSFHSAAASGSSRLVMFVESVVTTPYLA